MSQNVKQVCPIIPAPTDNEVRKMVSKPMLDMAYEFGLDRAAKTLGCCVKTVSRARDEGTTLRADTLMALIWNSPAFMDEILIRIGKRAVPIEAKCDTDAMTATAGAVHNLAIVQSPQSDGGIEVTDRECLQIEPEIDAALNALSTLKMRCHAIRERAA